MLESERDDRAWTGVETMERCRTCKHFIPSDCPRDLGAGSCDSPKIKRGYHVTTQEILPDGALVEDDEGRGIVVTPDFGCVHHEPADTPTEVGR
jgi:hypothetical protein